MFINVSISLGVDDATPGMTPQEMLIALGGDPDKDSINVSVSASHAPPPPEIVPAAVPPAAAVSR